MFTSKSILGANLGRRVLLPALVAGLSLSTAFIGAALLGGDGGIDGVNRFVETLSGDSGSVLGDLGRLAPLGFAFAAGMVSAVNPCGFVMLPAYLGLYLRINEKDGKDARPIKHVARAFQVGASVTIGFIALFGTVGLIMSLGARAAVVDILPWLGLTIGIALAVTGSWMVGGGKLYTGFAAQAASRIGRSRTGQLARLLPLWDQLRHSVSELHPSHLPVRHRDQLRRIQHCNLVGSVPPLRPWHGNGHTRLDPGNGLLQGSNGALFAKGAPLR